MNNIRIVRSVVFNCVKMKNFSYLLIFISSLIFFSCSKSEEPYGSFSKAEFLKHVDITSDLIIFIPDIQIYTYYDENNRYLIAIIDRILELNDNGFRIKAVVQAGDITNHNTLKEWQTAKRIFSKLDNKIPYMMCTGNHDYGDFGHGNNRETHYSEFFNYSMDPSFIASSEKNRYDNSFFRILIHDQPFQIFSLEFAPTNDVIAWADSIAGANENETGLVLTHAYLYGDKERFDFSQNGYSQLNSPYDYEVSQSEDVNDGEEIWQKLVFPNKNISFVLCGHMSYPDYVGNLISENSYGNDCLQLLFDTQSFPNGGNGWIQILEFKNDLKKVNILTYSAVSNSWMAGNTQLFQFMYD